MEFSQLITIEKCKELISQNCTNSTEFIWIMLTAAFLTIIGMQLAKSEKTISIEGNEVSLQKLGWNMLSMAGLILTMYLLWYAFIK